ncbi:MAG: hypothetical protein B7Z45_05340 [Azorhizobium sp. 12-66-6]|nr:MAG: hypothetical protein B7Z45_05340 [Azorhizobium sp. 12-66-6]
MAERVVDGFEIVEVEEQQGKAMRVHVLGEERVELLQEMQAVRQRGQFVLARGAIGVLGEFLLRPQMAHSRDDGHRDGEADQPRRHQDRQDLRPHRA